MPKIGNITPHLLGSKGGAATWASTMILVKVETTDGRVGYGEAVPTLRAKVVCESVKEIARAYKGREAFEIERNRMEWAKNDFYLHRSFESTTAMSAVDIALWDLVGKTYGISIHQMLGGPYRDKIPVYANGWYDDCRTPEQFAKKAKELKSDGYTALKFDPFGGHFNTIDAGGIRTSSKIVGAVREVMGDEAKLMIEHHGRFNAESAISIAKELGRYDPLFMEEPVHPNDMMGLQRYRDNTDVRVALGERILDKEEAAIYIMNGLVDILQPDICNIGGFTEIRKVAAIAEAADTQLAPHNAFGPIQNAATIQFDAAIPNLEIQESFYDFFPKWKREIIGDGTKVIDGHYLVNKGPGLGIDVNEKLVEKYEFDGMEEWNPDEPVWVVRGTWGGTS